MDTIFRNFPVFIKLASHDDRYVQCNTAMVLGNILRRGLIVYLFHLTFIF